MTEIFDKGGPLMYLILLCSIVSCAIFIERLYHFKRADIPVNNFMKDLRDKIRKQLYVEAITFCSETSGPISAVLKSGLVKHESGRTRIRESMEDASIHELSRLEKNIPIIATVSHISPLLGLLGTVLGMIECFMVIQTKSGIVNPTDLAGGISEALLTTAGGLVVAIPSYMAYSYLISRVEGYSMEIEKTTTEIIDLIEESKKEFKI